MSKGNHFAGYLRRIKFHFSEFRPLFVSNQKIYNKNFMLWKRTFRCRKRAIIRAVLNQERVMMAGVRYVKFILFSIFFTLLFLFLGKTIWMLMTKVRGNYLYKLEKCPMKWLDTGVSSLAKFMWQVIEKFCHTLELSKI